MTARPDSTLRHAFEIPKCKIVSDTHKSLREIKDAASSTDSLKLVSYDSGTPILSIEAQRAIFHMISWEKKKAVYNREAGHSSPYLRSLSLPKDGYKACRAARESLIGELAQVMNPEDDQEKMFTAMALATRLVEEGFETDLLSL